MASLSQVVPPPVPPPENSESDKTLDHIVKFMKLMLTLFEGGPD